MPQTATAQKPETTGHISILAALLEGMNGVDINTYAPEEPHKCKHYVELGVIEEDETRRMIVLRASLVDTFNKKIDELKAKGLKRDDLDRATLLQIGDMSTMLDTLGSLINYAIEREFPDFNREGVPISFGPGFTAGYTDHSLASFLGDETDLPQGLKDLLGGFGGMTIVIGRGGPGRPNNDPPVQ